MMPVGVSQPWRRRPVNWLWRGSLVALLALLLCGLSACAVLPEVERDEAVADAAFAERGARLAAVTEWRFAGRLALELPGESWTGQLSWRSQANGQIIDLSGPMGRGGGRLFIDGDAAVLLTRDGERFEAADPDTLLARIAGRDLPVSGLSYWVRGMARPGAGFAPRVDPSGQPSRLIQDGWEIIYGDFEPMAPVAMPRAIELRRDDVLLRLAIDRWLVSAADPES
jgi:outer membrane lipoprotein LolB